MSVLSDAQEIAGHRLSEAVIERLPSLTTVNHPSGRISYSEVVAFHNIVRGGQIHVYMHSVKKTNTFVPR